MVLSSGLRLRTSCRGVGERRDMPALKASLCTRALLLTGLLAVTALLCPVPQAQAVDTSPFDKLVGRWVGEGRLGVRDNATEQVKCRVTYIVPSATDQLQQTIRCASASGSIEVRSTVTAVAGAGNSSAAPSSVPAKTPPADRRAGKLSVRIS